MQYSTKSLTELNRYEMRKIYGGSGFFKNLGCRARNMWESVKTYMTENEFSYYYTNQYNL